MFLKRKLTSMMIVMSTLLFLVACGSAEDLTKYVEVSFSGMDSQGSVNFDVDETRLIEEVFNLEGHQDFPDVDTAREAQEILDAYSIEVDPQEDLSNGDQVKITVLVDENKTKKIVGGEKEVTVEGLDEPEVLTTEAVEENLVLNFNGVSGRGVSQIDNIFDESPLDHLDFQIENDGELKNGDEALVIIDADAKDTLHSHGYVLDEDFQPSFTVENLDVVAEKATDIKNLEDLERFLDEELRNAYKDTDYGFGYNAKYEINQEKLMYRQFDKETDTSLYEDDNHGNLIGIFSIEEYQISKDDKKLIQKFTAIYGFSGILLDDEGQANLSDLRTISERKGDTYSLESVIQLTEGDGYEEVKK